MKSIFTTLVTFFVIQSASAATGLQIDGFGSLYYGQAQGDILGTGATNKQPQFAQYSLIGLNLYSKLENNFSVGAQLLATGASAGATPTVIRDSSGDVIQLPNEKPFNMNAEWAFLSYDPSGDFSARLGRLLFPTWIAGEYLRVGYLLPYRKLPDAVYILAPFTAFDGVSFTKSFDIGGPRLIAALYGGTPALNYPSVQLSNMYGASVSVEGEGWAVKATYLTIQASLNLGTGSDIGTFSKLSSLGYKVDKNNFVSWGEAFYGSAAEESDKIPGTNTRFAEEEGGGYVLLGYRIGKFTPRYTYTESHTKYGFLSDAKYKSHTVGLNYEINNQAAFKVEVEMIEVPELFAPVTGTAPAGTATLFGDKLAATDKTKGQVVYAGFDFTF